MIQFNDENKVVKDEVKAILVGVQKREDISFYMDELAALTEAVSGRVLGMMTQRMEKIDSSTFIGKGKAQELCDMCERLEANTIIFNDELSGMQMRNLEEITGARVIDRTILILDIFASRATSKEGKLQVELAQLQYRMPRLLGFGKSLSRLGGGIGTRGPGEKKLEVDKRHIRKRIDDIKMELKEARSKRATQRSKREKSDIPVVALVGYTNAGKSAIMNYMLNVNEHRSRDDIESKKVSSRNMLFETLDIQQRLIRLDKNKEFILIDTVGFVSKLPHSLIEAFKGTLEEVRYADLLVHVVDISYDDFAVQEEITDKVVKELGVSDKAVIKVYNKIDKIKGIRAVDMDGKVYISALNDINMESFISQIEKRIFSDKIDALFTVPFSRGDIVSFLHNKGEVIEEKYGERGTDIRVMLKREDFERIKKYGALQND